MAGQGVAGFSSLSFSVIHIFSHFVFNVSLYFPVFVVCAMRMTWPRTILLPQMMGSDHAWRILFLFIFREEWYRVFLDNQWEQSQVCML